jgi:hypothetical protein
VLEYALKVLATSVLVVAASEAAKRSTLAGAILASLPLTSLLAMVWLWAETKDPEKVAALAHGIFWLLLPSLALLFALPLLLRKDVPFAPALLIAVALTVASYFAMIKLLRWLGIEI